MDPHDSRFLYLQISLLLQFIYNPKINTHSTFKVIHRQAKKKNPNLSDPMCTFPAEVKQGDALPSCSALIVLTCPFCNLFSATWGGVGIFELFVGDFSV